MKSLLLLIFLLWGCAAWAEPEVQTDVEFGNVKGRALKLDVIRYRDQKVRPAVIFYHGGSWSGGSKDEFGDLRMRLAQHGYVVFSVDYRLSGEAIFPAQVEDCKCAVRWLRAHAQEYGVDPRRIGAWGSSAGAHLAALLGTAGDAKDLEGSGGFSEYSSRVQAVVDMYGPSDFTATSTATIPKSLPLDAPNHPDNPKSAVARFLGGPLSQVPEQGRRASVTTYVSPDDCPFLILHGDHDALVPLQQSKLLAEILTKAGVPNKLLVFPGGVHGLKEFREQYYPQVEGFFDGILKP